MSSPEARSWAQEYGSVSISRSEEVDLELVQDIIDRAPRSATTFPQVYKAYGDVLQGHRINPAADTAYYQFLLRLGVVRAPTWGEKWDLYLASNSLLAHSLNLSRSADRAPPQSPPEHSPSHARSRHLPRPPAPAAQNEKVARIPFLASASSDLDLGFEADTVDEAPAELREGGSVIQHLRPSPRKALAWSQRDKAQASLVGYSPSRTIGPSIEEEDPFATLPARTSTPLGHRSARHERLAYDEDDMAPLPPYSESDVNSTQTSVIQGTDILYTPRPSHDGIWEDDEPRVPGLDDWEERELLDKADRFYQTGLLGRCLDVWVNANEWIRSTNAQIDSVRSNILIRQSMLHWQARLDRVLSMPGAADAHRRYQLQSSALTRWLHRLKAREIAAQEALLQERSERRTMKASWSRWRLRLVKNRTKRWEADMLARERALVKQRDMKLKQAHLAAWYDAFRDSQNTRVADQTYARNIVSAVFVEWYHQALRKRTAEDRLVLLLQRQGRDAVQRAFDVWSRRTQMVALEATVAQNSERRLLRRHWEQWRVTSYHNRQADAFRRLTLLSTVLRRWQARMKRLRVLVGKSAIHAKRQDTRTLRQAFELWITRERGELLLRVREQRASREILTRWHHRLLVNREMEAAAIALKNESDQNLLRRCLRDWKRCLIEHDDDLSRADLVYNFKRLHGVFHVWQQVAVRASDNTMKADGAAAFFAQRTAIRVWKSSMARRRQVKAVKARQLAELKDAFARWRWETERAIETQVTVVRFQGYSDLRMKASMLRRWTERVISIKARDLDVKEQRDQRVVSRAMTRWLDRTVRAKDQHSLAMSFVEVKKQDLLRQYMRQWRVIATRRRQHQDLAQQFTFQAEKRTLVAAFFAWQSACRARQLAPIEEEVALRNEDALLFTIWDTWKSRATQLPAVSFRNSRLRRLAWGRWGAALENARQIKELRTKKDRELLDDVLAVWREAAARKIARKGSRVRPRMRVSSGNHSTSRPASPHLPVHPQATARPYAIDAFVPTQARAISARYVTPLNRRSFTPPAVSYSARKPSGSIGDDDSETVVSEPAYDRLRTELSTRRGRGGSEPPGEHPAQAQRSASASGSSVVGILRDNLPRRP